MVIYGLIILNGNNKFYVTFVTGYLIIVVLLVIVDFFLCLTYRLNFIIGCTYREEHSIYSVQYYSRFQAPVRGCGMYPPRITGAFVLVSVAT